MENKTFYWNFFSKTNFYKVKHILTNQSFIEDKWKRKKCTCCFSFSVKKKAKKTEMILNLIFTLWNYKRPLYNGVF